MPNHELVTPSTRIIEVGASDGDVAQALAQSGAQRYLGLVPTEAIGSVDVPPDLAGRFHPLRSEGQVRQNNAELLILRAPFVRVLWGLRDLGHVRYIAVERATPSDWAEARAAQLISRVLGKVRSRGRRSWGGKDFDIIEVGRDRRPRPRHYLSETLGVDGLIRRLSDDEIQYVVLRWFEELPTIQPGEDLDVLVADADLERLHKLLAEEPGTIPVDVYSETGLEGADFRSMAYYPPPQARQMLDRAVEHPSGCRVPCPEDHLYSLAYHAVYHKGAHAGLASEVVSSEAQPDHDYAAALTAISTQLGRDFPTDLEAVDESLDAVGWRPPLDTLRRLAESNAWVHRRFFAVAEDASSELPEPAVFFVRERTMEVLNPDDVMAVIERFEFEVLAVHRLSDAARLRCAASVRGGNWGRGPFPVSGGEPVLVVVVVHYGPRRPRPALLARYPRLTNGDILHAKEDMRAAIEQRIGSAQSFNPVHSSDNELEAWEYLQVAMPEELPALRREVESRRARYQTTRPVRAVLSAGRRAKVEVVESEDGHTVVRKTFAPHAYRYMERELAALRDLEPHVRAVPTLLATGPNWFEIEHYENTLDALPDRPDGQLVPLDAARGMVAILREIHALGADVVDAKPHNFLLDPAAGLKLVDFEFYHRYAGNPPEFDRIYAFDGVPPDFTGDIPFGELSFSSRWQPFVGLSRRSLLHDPPWRQRVGRALHRTARLSSAASGAARRTQSAVRKARGRLGAGYRQWARDRARAVLPVGDAAQGQPQPGVDQ